MNKRDLIFTASGMLFVVSGVGFLVAGHTRFALIPLFLLGAVVLILLVLQRRQLAAVQDRTLQVMRVQKEALSKLKRLEEQRNSASQKTNSDLPAKKILGVLSAQQTSMEILNKKVQNLSHDQNR